MGKHTTLILCLVLLVILTAGCAPHAVGPSASEGGGDGAAGFWKGLWHGFIVTFTFIVSLFKDGVGIYEANNTGHLYDLGYLLGVMIFFGGSGGGACSRGK